MTSHVHRWVWISIVALTACKGGDVGGKAAPKAEETDVAKAPVAPAEPVKPADPAPTAAPATKTVYFDVHELGAGKATAKVAAEEHAKATAATDKTVAFADYWSTRRTAASTTSRPARASPPSPPPTRPPTARRPERSWS